VIKLNSPDDAASVAKAIDEKFANSSFETKTETESAFAAGFAKQFGNIELLILTIGGVVFFTLCWSPATLWPFPFANALANLPFSRLLASPGALFFSLCWRSPSSSPLLAACSV